MYNERLTKRGEDNLIRVVGINDHEVALSELKTLDIVMIVRRLAFLEDKIESGELVDRNDYLDHLMSAKTISELTDKEIEFFVKHNAKIRKFVDEDITSLTAENAELKKRLDNAVELPCVQCVITLEWICVEKRAWRCFKQWVVLYKDSCDQIVVEPCTSKDAAEARLEELKGVDNDKIL